MQLYFRCRTEKTKSSLAFRFAIFDSRKTLAKSCSTIRISAHIPMPNPRTRSVLSFCASLTFCYCKFLAQNCSTIRISACTYRCRLILRFAIFQIKQNFGEKLFNIRISAPRRRKSSPFIFIILTYLCRIKFHRSHRATCRAQPPFGGAARQTALL